MSIGRDGVGLEPQSADPAAVLVWARARDAAVRGLVHALSNRVGTVAAVAAMLDDGAGDGVPAGSVGTAGRILAGEGERLEALLAFFRAASADPFGLDAAPEPVHVPELLAEVVALAAYAVPEVVVRVEAGPEVRPAMASRAALGQALLACVCAAGGGEVVLRAMGEDAGGVTVVVVEPGLEGAPTDAQCHAAGAATWLLAGKGGEAAVRGGGVAITVPALGREGR